MQKFDERALAVKSAFTRGLYPHGGPEGSQEFTGISQSHFENENYAHVFQSFENGFK